ncbi:MAG: hypothetical protein AAF383_09315 [Cyanobacteria bacterium P01_A01_bin.83]
MSLSLMRRFLDKTKYWYENSKQRQQLSFWIIYGLAIYLPFEEFFVKLLPLHGSILFFFKITTGELIIYALFIKLIYDSVSGKKTFKTTPIDLLLIAFIIVSFISISINQAPIAGSLVNLRPLLRYVAVYYLIVNSKISKQQLNLLFKSLKTICLIQSVLATVQYFSPRSITKLFVPRGSGVSFGGHERYMTGTKVGAAVGTIGRPAAFTSFIFVAFSIFLVKTFKTGKSYYFTRNGLLWTLVIFFGIFATLKRASLIIILLIPVVLLLHLGKKKKALVISWLYTMFALGLALVLLSINLEQISFSGTDARKESIDPSVYLVQIFTPDYYEQASENSRGWMIQTVSRSVLGSDKIWFGISPNQNVVRNTLIKLNSSSTLAQKRFEVTETFEDVYWVAMLAYYGVTGLGIYLLIILRLYLAARWLICHAEDSEYQSLGAIFCTLILVSFIYAWIEKIWEIQTFTFYFWLLAGLVINSCSAVRENYLLAGEKKT